MRYRLVEKRWFVVREEANSNPRAIGNPDKAASLARDIMPDDEREHFFVVFLNAQNHYKGHYEVSTGTLSASLVHPREVFKPVILASAASVILVHNHPSGDPTPSKEDLRLTRQLVEVGELLDIPVRDHIIIGNGTSSWASLAVRGEM